MKPVPEPSTELRRNLLQKMTSMLTMMEMAFRKSVIVMTATVPLGHMQLKNYGDDTARYDQRELCCQDKIKMALLTKQS